MNDKELLELAAKAAGFPAGWVIQGWNPLDDDGDALRLAVLLSMMLDTAYNDCISVGSASLCEIFEPYNDDPCAATRRAIVRAAAEIGSRM